MTNDSDNTPDSDPLKAVRSEILAYANPAYIKDSELRYVAVNDAYAQLWGLPASELIGNCGDQLHESADYQDRDEKERRSLVFGKNQVALFDHPMSDRRYRIRIERLKRANGETFICGLFENFSGVQYYGKSKTVVPTGPVVQPMPEEKNPDNTVSVRGDLEIVRKALESSEQPMAILARDGRVVLSNEAYRSVENDEQIAWVAEQSHDGSQFVRGEKAEDTVEHTVKALRGQMLDLALHEVDAGILICDGDDRLQFFNERFVEFYDGFLPKLTTGMKMRAILDELHAKNAVVELQGAKDEREWRDSWVSKRNSALSEPRYSVIEKLASGRWIKSVNRRLDNGLMILVVVDITRLKERETLLKRHVEEIEIYKAVINELPIAVYVKDEQFQLTFVNRAYSELTGRDAADIIGKNDIEIYGEQEGQVFREDDIAALETGEIRQREEILTRSDGTEVALIARKRRVKTANNAIYLVGSSIDVSEQRRREYELFQARKNAELVRSDLESVIDGMRMGIVVVDADCNIELINSAFFQIWKQTPRDDLIGQPFREVMEINRYNGIYDVEEAEWEDYVAMRVDEIREGYVEPRQFERADGFTLIYAVKSLSQNKRMVTYFDVSDLKERERQIEAAREEAEEADELLREATSAMAQGLCIYDDEIRLTNPSFHRLTGLTTEELQPGMPWTHMLDLYAEKGFFGDEEQAQRTIASIKDEVAGRRAHVHERRGARNRWLRVDVKPAPSGRMIATYSNLTESKKREEQLEGLLGQAEMADRAKSEFLANMSHEIRTPMNGVLGMAELLARTNLDTQQKTFTDIIVKSGNALLTIINDILDFSKIDAGQMILHEAPFNLAETIEDVATLMSPQIAERDMELIVRLPQNMPARVIGDIGRVRQILVNLIGNAAKFTESGHVLINVRCETLENSRVDLEINVEDTGIGIPEDKLQSIFDKFSQVDGSSTRRHEGTGLGLAIASRLAQMMNGALSVTSEVGVGSTFTFKLGLPVDSAAAPAKPIPYDVSGARILVIDDNAVNRNILTEQLSGWGFDSCAMPDGESGMEVIAAAQDAGYGVDAVILDFHMPGMDGGRVAHAIRQDLGMTDLPIVMLTSMDIACEELRFSKAGVNICLTKPARSSLLAETLVSVLQEARHKKYGAASPHAEHDDEAGSSAPTASNAPQAVTTQSEADDTKDAQLDRGIDLLVAEDNEVNQIVFSQIIDELGYSYRIVANGEEAVAASERLRPGLILMDVSMPKMNGHEAASAIRELEAATGRHVPIIGVTAHALTGDRERCIEAGMDDYMSKPISPDKLGEKISHWLGDKRKGQRA